MILFFKAIPRKGVWGPKPEPGPPGKNVVVGSWVSLAFGIALLRPPTNLVVAGKRESLPADPLCHTKFLLLKKGTPKKERMRPPQSPRPGTFTYDIRTESG